MDPVAQRVLNYLTQEWPVVRRAPVALSIIALISAGVGWKIAAEHYEGTIREKDAALETLEQRRANAQERADSLQLQAGKSDQQKRLYVMVSKEGRILFTENFDEYGLRVEKIDYESFPAYQLTFEKEPARIRIETEVNATRDLVRISSNVYRVRFIGAGFGNPIIECDFTIEAFKRG
jgi:hypothetical protein